MKKILLSCSILFAAMLANSCSSLVVSNFNDLSMLRKGMDTSKVDQLFDNDNLRDRQTFFVANTNYTVKNVLVLVQYVQRTETGANGRQTTRMIPVYNVYRLVFDRGRLIYWGFDYEFNMHEDPEMRKIGALLKGFITKEGN